MAAKVEQLSEGEICMTGTCKFTNMDAMNRVLFKEGIEMLKDKPRGSWVLTRMYNNTNQYDDVWKKSADPCIKNWIDIPDEMVQKNSGFIIFKDNKVVVFYTNDFKFTPTQWILDGSAEVAIECAHGLVALKWWLGNEVCIEQLCNYFLWKWLWSDVTKQL